MSELAKALEARQVESTEIGRLRHYLSLAEHRSDLANRAASYWRRSMLVTVAVALLLSLAFTALDRSRMKTIERLRAKAEEQRVDLQTWRAMYESATTPDDSLPFSVGSRPPAAGVLQGGDAHTNRQR